MKNSIIFLIIVIAVGVAGFFFFGPQIMNDVIYQDAEINEEVHFVDDDVDFVLRSPVFENAERIPVRYTCDGDSVNPPLEIVGIPEDTRSLVLIMDDPDIPDSVKQEQGIDVFDHWVVFNIPPTVTSIREGQEPEGVLGRNSRGSTGYIGSCPPAGEEHRYFFKLYALDRMLNLEERATKRDVEQALRGHILAETVLMGLYQRNQ